VAVEVGWCCGVPDLQRQHGRLLDDPLLDRQPVQSVNYFMCSDRSYRGFANVSVEFKTINFCKTAKPRHDTRPVSRTSGEVVRKEDGTVQKKCGKLMFMKTYV